ncbi:MULTISPECIES: ABC transporter permease [Thermoactinomyces]|jgi:general nucleoside transport system permease protein|uniref:ABC transporter permease n=1 Tax=Thermoactinomyces daqus TaxID=1329516 RepID=A0A7W1X950_9BACL|nr:MULTISPECIES: ABC transporter permease [Thermoactinomyces]MBA4542259.1 ABC transporter permease [Thermoactinomyces daqus]MBH8598289.1 ABC transporter permease [Thermoactinomyces sp. CICC 10523]MBH8604412.1 ABC transporter permease [Thermoactinomyces sp. CICC 10522]MBH8608473.1 ABC transporter permease [Thermoactinomyces sp. CICC 10521]
MLETLTNILSMTVLYSTPLILAGLGGLYSERSGVVNIGLEGLMTIGAFTGAVTTIFFGNAWIGLLCAIVAGILLALPHAIASITFKADQVVSGVAINFLALGLAVYLTKHMYNGSSQTPVVPDKLSVISIPLLNKIPVLGPSIFQALPTTYIAIALVIITYFLFYQTSFGMRLRAVGEHPHAAETAGINVIVMRYIAVMISGALAAIGGAGLSIAIGSQFTQVTVAGQGFIALAALIFGKWRPFGVLWAGLFFGLAVALALTGQLYHLTNYVPSEVLSMLPYILTILALAGFVGKAEPPAANGKPYEKGAR